MTPGRTFSNHGPNNNTPQNRNRWSQQSPQRADEDDNEQFHGLPEFLYQQYEQNVDVRANRDRPLLVDAHTGWQITYYTFRDLASILATRLNSGLGLTVGSTVAICSDPNINIPVVCAASWEICASVVAFAPDSQPSEMSSLTSQTHVPSVIFITLSQLPVIRQMLTIIHEQSFGAATPPHIVVFDVDTNDQIHPHLTDEERSASRFWALDELYSQNPQDVPFERPPLDDHQAQEFIAIYYCSFHRDENNQMDITSIYHVNAISLYQSQANNIRRSPSWPQLTSGIARPPPQPQLPHSRPPSTRQTTIEAVQRRGIRPLVYSVLQMHRPYRLHSIICDLFCRGAAYLIAEDFDPAEFVLLVSAYQLEAAELTFTEINHLIAYLNTQDMDQPVSVTELTAGVSADVTSISSTPSLQSLEEMLATIQTIYTDSREAESQLAPSLLRLLPHVQILCTRFGSYVEPLDLGRRQ